MELILDLDIKKCVGCGACAVACMDQNDFDIRLNQFRTVTNLEETVNGKLKYTSISITCMHCEEAPCIASCPAGCISKDPETNLTVVDNSNCIGCHSCAMACPFGAPNFNAVGKMIKCDGCIDRVKHDMQPACVQICPFDALKMYDKQTYQQQKVEKSLHQITRVML